jgi:predicted DCC family thiol-disulfide oxidoreductase YuxK
MNAGIDKPVILFDGICNLCQGSVQFVLKHDKRRQFLFASLQSEIANALLATYLHDFPRPDSFVLIENGKMFLRSTAALRVCRKLNPPFPLLYSLIVIPAFIRDAVYDWVAKNRYRWFGKMKTCWIPTPELSARFLDQSGLHQPVLPGE